VQNETAGIAGQNGNDTCGAQKAINRALIVKIDTLPVFSCHLTPMWLRRRGS
jgi:hypothetical protein